jgi:hypothetical protein
VRANKIRKLRGVSGNILEGAVTDGNIVFFLSGSRAVVEHEVRVSYYYMRPTVLRHGYSISVPAFLERPSSDQESDVKVFTSALRCHHDCSL